VGSPDLDLAAYDKNTSSGWNETASDTDGDLDARLFGRNRPNMCRQMVGYVKVLTKLPVYVCLIFALSCCYFVVTGVQCVRASGAKPAQDRARAAQCRRQPTAALLSRERALSRVVGGGPPCGRQCRTCAGPIHRGFEETGWGGARLTNDLLLCVR
jgi:hypothetical protein